MLHALIERASYGELYLRAQQPEKHKLAPLPRELRSVNSPTAQRFHDIPIPCSHFDMEAFYDRPVQKELVDYCISHVYGYVSGSQSRLGETRGAEGVGKMR